MSAVLLESVLRGPDLREGAARESCQPTRCQYFYECTQCKNAAKAEGRRLLRVLFLRIGRLSSIQEQARLLSLVRRFKIPAQTGARRRVRISRSCTARGAFGVLNGAFQVHSELRSMTSSALAKTSGIRVAGIGIEQLLAIDSVVSNVRLP